MRWRSRLLVASLLLISLPTVINAPTVVSASTTPSACTPNQVTLSATPDQSNYASGTTVRVTIALRNRSAAVCSFVTGPFSPNFTLTNADHVTVWASCWFGGRPAPCAYFLVHRTLAPGATYRDRLSWDQRTGHPDLAVPVGRYAFRANFMGLSLRAATSFVITPPHGATVTLADSGRTIVLAQGDLLTVRLIASPMVWAKAVSSDPRVVVSVPEMNPVAGLFVFRASAPGSARVTAVGNPSCYPQCLMPSRLFYVNVTVRAT